MDKRVALVLPLYFGLGFIAIITQVHLVREFLVSFQGNEICIGLIFTVWFMGISLGAIGYSGLNFFRSKGLGLFTSLVWLAIFLPFLEIAGLRYIRLLFSIPAGQLPSLFHLLFSSLIFLFPSALIIGLLFPAACQTQLMLQANCSYRSNTKSNSREDLDYSPVPINLVYILEACGSLAAGAVHTWIMADHFTPLVSCWITVILLLPLLFCFHLAFNHRAMARFSLVIIGAMGILFWLHLPQKIEHITTLGRWNSLKTGSQLLKTVHTPFQVLQVGKAAQQYSLFANGKYWGSFPDPYTYRLPSLFYLSLHPSPQRILLVGLGIGGLVEQMLQFPLEHLDYCLHDSKIVSLVKERLSPAHKTVLEDKRLKIRPVDGRLWIKTTPFKYDLVIINIPPPSTAMLNRYYTLDFFQEIRSRIKEDGVMAIRLDTPFNYFDQTRLQQLTSVYKSIQKVFPNILLIPGQPGFMAATSQAIKWNASYLKGNIFSQNLKEEVFNPHHLDLLLEPKRQQFALREVEKKLVEVDYNLDAKPISYYYNLVAWDKMTGNKLEYLFKFCQSITSPGILALVLIFLLLSLTFASRRVKKTPILPLFYLLGSTGFFGMTISLVIIYQFQNYFGYIYREIGLLTGLFMAGLATGGYLIFIARKRWPKIDCYKTLLVSEIAILLFLTLFPWLSPTQDNNSHIARFVFYALMIIGGVITGSQFPLVGDLLVREKIKTSIVASIIDGADHLGAMAGAFFTAIYFLPVLGVKSTFMILVLIKLAALWGLWELFIYRRLVRR